MTGFMDFPFVEVLEIGGWCRDCTHAARRLTRFSGPGHCCSANHPKWSGWQELHLRPPRSERGRLLLTLHPEKNGARGRSLTFIPGVRSAVLCGLSYASVNGGNGRDCTFVLLHVGQALCGLATSPEMVLP